MQMARIVRVTLAGMLLFTCLLILSPGSELRPSGAQDRIQWFREAKFGMFIHWGPYSRLAGEWNGRRIPAGQQAEWIMHTLRIPVAEYREMAHQFNPVKFDAGRWVRLAKSTGMKYLVITAKHHDGFSMYRSRISNYNIVDWTSFKRDPFDELARACREEGIRFCFYYSHREDWDHPDAYGNNWDYDEAHKNFDRYLEEKSKPQVRELLTNYGPVGLVWFDRGLYTPEQARRFVDLVRSVQPECLINGRVGNYGQELMGDYQSMSDNGMPPGGLDEYWETPQTLNETWGYSRFDRNWKDSRTVVRRLVEIASKGGNYLLNIGPMGDGTIPQETLEIFGQVGAWMNENSDSIYGTSASPFPELPWGRCTVRGEMLYLHVLDWPDNRTVSLPGLRNEVRAAYPMRDPSRSLRYEHKGYNLSVQLPPRPSHPADTVIVVKIAGILSVDPPVVAQNHEEPIHLDYRTARTSGNAAKRFNRDGGFHISRWTAPGDQARWHIKAASSGLYRVKIRYAARREWHGAKYRVSVDSQSVTATVEPTGDWYQYRTFALGTVRLKTQEETVVTLGPDTAISHYLMYLESLSLERLQ